MARASDSVRKRTVSESVVVVFEFCEFGEELVQLLPTVDVLRAPSRTRDSSQLHATKDTAAGLQALRQHCSVRARVEASTSTIYKLVQ